MGLSTKKKIVASLGAAFLGAALSTVPLPVFQDNERLPSNRMSLVDMARLAFGQQQLPAVDMDWTDARGAPTANAKILLGVLQDAGTHGLNPATYKTDEIARLMIDPAQTQKLDHLLTQALVAYAQDMTGPRIDPAVARSRFEYWREPLSRSEVISKFSQTKDMGVELKALEPAAPLYGALKRELARLAALPPEPVSGTKIVINGLLFPGQGHKAVPDIRARMGLPAKTGAAATKYDDQLVEAIKKFQGSHGLDPDGVIGPGTVEQMNFTNADRIVQVIANLERLRWDLPRPDRYIEVNIASQTLQAHENGKIVLNIDMIVGRPTRQTREFHTVMTGARFNPTWNVPSGIMQKDKIPELQKNPYALEEKEIYVYVDGKKVDPGTIDWNNLTDEELKHIKLKQAPGAKNALGWIRVLMEDRYDQYLHYTNQPELFDKGQRTLSSGCMRMKEPEKVVAFLMGMDQATIDKYRNGAATNVNIRAPRQTDFYSVYRSVLPQADGSMKYYPDVYNRDRDIYEALKKMNMTPPMPVYNSNPTPVAPIKISVPPSKTP